MRYLLVLLLVTPVFAAEEAEDTTEVFLNDFSGGIDTLRAPHKIPLNMSPNLRNVLVDEIPGSLITRKGFKLAGSTNTLGRINFMLEFNNDNGEREFIISDSSVVLTTKDFVEYEFIKGSLNQNNKLRGAQVRNKIWFTNGADDVFNYDGTTVVVLAGDTFGTVTRPDVPKGKYIAVYLERGFVFNDDTDNSLLSWSRVASTNGFAVAPDTELAWDTVNSLSIGQGDGTTGTALFIQNAQLRMGKERSIHTLFGTFDSAFNARRTIDDVGVASQESVVSLDDISYLQNKNGVYAFDGGRALRISDPIRAEVDAAVSNSAKIVSDVWKDKDDFDRGQHHNSTSPVANTEILIIETTGTVNLTDMGDSFETGDFLVLNDVSTATPFITLEPTPLAKNYSGRLSTITFSVQSILGAQFCNGTIGLEFVFIDTDTKNTATFVRTFNSDDVDQTGIRTRLELTTGTKDTLDLRTTDFNINRIQYKISLDTSQCTLNELTNIHVSSMGVQSTADILLATNTAGFFADVTTITTITFWDNFESQFETNGGVVNFFYKTATDAVNITTYPWIPITPGSVIGSSATDTRIQWATTMTAVNQNTPPTIDSVSIKHNEGGSNQAASFAMRHMNRYWLFLSSDTDGVVFTGFIKSRITNSNPNAWVIFSGIPIFSMGDFSDTFHGGGDGQIFTLDSGTNDNGTAIDAFYETPDLSMGNPFRQKKIGPYFIDVEKQNGATLTVGISREGGSFVDISEDINGVGRLLRPQWGIRNNSVDIKGKFYRFRFRNNELDKRIRLNGFLLDFQPSEVDK